MGVIYIPQGVVGYERLILFGWIRSDIVLTPQNTSRYIDRPSTTVDHPDAINSLQLC